LDTLPRPSTARDLSLKTASGLYAVHAWRAFPEHAHNGFLNCIYGMRFFRILVYVP
jgi:hypothetical protein